MAKPRAKAPTKTVVVRCSACSTALFKYHKGGKGSLVKCFKTRIAKDYTLTPCVCPECGSEFAREQMIRGVPAYKIISGKARI
ncbi:hypothetical protein [Neptunomonas marina]|uniref:Zn-ribbon motif protein n=1 Tax=Neptunomonas marina TaxID=1815562 RepID=A0A437Q8D0_9GAMM|nr:hypothetical protein [Neptunomonas marina]RVU30801.1 hypothetical protein EOE65_10865 [Neptunomonas marina]